MPARKKNGQFIKGGGRKSRRARSGSKSITIVQRAAPKRRSSGGHRKVRHHRRRRHGAHGAMPRLIPLALTSAALAYITSENGPKFITENAAKIPGVKTFGAPAMAGIACLAVDKFVKPNKWLKLLGIAGIVTAAMQVGRQGPGFKWLGDVEGDGYDVGDDVGDEGDVEDVEGDD